MPRNWPNLDAANRFLAGIEPGEELFSEGKLLGAFVSWHEGDPIVERGGKRAKITREKIGELVSEGRVERRKG